MFELHRIFEQFKLSLVHISLSIIGLESSYVPSWLTAYPFRLGGATHIAVLVGKNSQNYQHERTRKRNLQPFAVPKARTEKLPFWADFDPRDRFPRSSLSSARIELKHS